MLSSDLKGGSLENKITNQLIIPTTVPTTYFQVVNTTIMTDNDFE